MTIAEMVKAEVMKLIGSGDAPAVVKATKAAKPVSDDLREKRLAALAKAREAKSAKAKGKAAPAVKAKPAAKAATAAKPARKGSIDQVAGVRVTADAYCSNSGNKSLLVGIKGKHQRLVFHSRDELVEFINDLRKQVGGDCVALADLHFGG